jgi:glyoxylase-like metal-dependent hydrolase (beta-lactamase superfamily II)
MEIITGVHQFKLPIPSATLADAGEMVGETNVYLIRGEDGWLLLDAGWDDPRNLKILEEELHAIGVNFKDISKIVITHFHYDHFGMAAKLRKLSGAALVLHRKEHAFIEAMGAKAKQTLRETNSWLLRNGTPEKELPDISFATDLGHPDILFSGGEKISTGLFNFEVVWTPGHSPGHICLYEREKKLLFSGDHMLQDITPEVGTSPLQYDNPLADYLSCLKNLRELEVDLVLPAHGPAFTHFRRRTDELIEHHQTRKAHILEILKSGTMNAYEIAARMHWIPQAGGIAWDKLDTLNRRLALLETWAHLRLLQEEGKVIILTRNGCLYYSLRIEE